jgi:DNA-binding FadR family transcriptional regulator
LSVRKRAHADHRAIVAALSTRDPEVAATAMQDHLEGMRQVLHSVLGQGERRRQANDLTEVSIFQSDDRR